MKPPKRLNPNYNRPIDFDGIEGAADVANIRYVGPPVELDEPMPREEYDLPVDMLFYALGPSFYQPPNGRPRGGSSILTSGGGK